ncbi:MAG: TRAP-type C4-dicarboxylate transport system permease small subunit [Desulforhopalus sp.]|jgi:TRAP-type C4-dicarboxylate transport system permease small subunit
MKKNISRILAISTPASLNIASLLLSIDLMIILFGVFMRYIVGGAPIWTDELARFLIIGGVMLAAGAVWVEGGHMRIDIIEKLLKSRLRKILIIYQWVLTIIIAIGAAIFSYRYAMSVSMFSTQGLGISRTIPMLSLPVGFALLAFHALLQGPQIIDVKKDKVQP